VLRASSTHDVSPPALKGAGCGWVVAAWVAFAAGALGGSAVPAPEARPEASALSASRLEAQALLPGQVAGVVEPLVRATLELPGAAGATAAARGRPDVRSWAAVRPHAQADAVIRRLSASGLRQDNGRMADRPSLCICSAQGPPVEA
jgi:hypothetical protein